MKSKLLFTIAIGAIAFSAIFAQNDTIAGWTFPTGNPIDSVANIGLETNLGRYISAEDTAEWPNTNLRKVEITEADVDWALTADGWDDGMDAKLWSIKFKAPDFADLKISSKLSSGTSKPGPRDWKIQCRFSGEDWVDISDGAITVADDWTTGVADALDLPDAFDNPGSSSMYIRWIMTSNTDINGDDVVSTGVSEIDDVIVTGTSTATGLKGVVYSNDLSVFPNPANDVLNISSETSIESVELLNMQGKVVKQVTNLNLSNINISDLSAGMYLVKIKRAGESLAHIKQIIIN